MMLPYFPQILDLVSQHGHACDVYLAHVCDYAPISYAHEHGHAAPFHPKVRACADDVRHAHGGVHDTMRCARECARVVQSSVDTNQWPSTTLRPKTKPTYFLEKTQLQGQLQKMGLPQNKHPCALLQDRVVPVK